MFDVTVIMPSSNRYPLNLLSLNALENQTFDLSKMEVILIDDASTDNTPQLKDFHPRYPFKYIRNQNKLGVSGTRNIGLTLAQGKIIVSLDAEMIVGCDYIKRHYQHHLNTPHDAVVVGVNKRKVFSYLFPRFNQQQINTVARLFEESPVFKERINNRVTKKNISNIELQAYIRQLKTPIQLIDPREVADRSLLNLFSRKAGNPLTRFLQQFPDNSCLGWMGCYGSNHSFPRKLISQTGGYDTDYKFWGMEDIDFSYRLYKSGAKFIIDPDIARYHQEHPMTGNKDEKNIRNTLLFEKKHPFIDACLRSLLLINVNDFACYDCILREYTLLVNKFPNQFQEFKRSLVVLLQQIPVSLLRKEKPFNLINSSVIGSDPMRRDCLFSERDQIAALGKYNNLVRLFDMLAGL